MLDKSKVTLGIELEFTKFKPPKPLACQFHTDLLHAETGIVVRAVVELLGDRVEGIRIFLNRDENGRHAKRLMELPEITREGNVLHLNIPSGKKLPDDWFEAKGGTTRSYMWMYSHPQTALNQGETMLREAGLKWSTDVDMSLSDWGYNAIEVQSPILGIEDLDEIDRVCTTLGNIEADETCGVHIHVGFENDVDDEWDLEDLKKLVTYWVANEESIFENPLVRDGAASRPVASRIDLDRLGRIQHIDEIHSGIRSGSDYALNLAPLRRYGTVEFRCFSGTTDANRVREYVDFVIELLEKALA